MCRLLAYLGPPLPLAAVLLEPEHSLVVQSYAPREMTAGTVNADGFGIAWYDRARREAPFLYRNILPIWSDANLPSLAQYVESGAVLANVRSATPGQGLDYVNTQPFVHGTRAMLHNGFVEGFRESLFRPLRERFTAESVAAVRGDTDSEHLAAWIAQHANGADGAAGVAAALAAAIDGLGRIAPGVAMSLNFVIGDGRGLVACRAALGGPAPSLYRASSPAGFPGAVLVASEPLDGGDGWTALEEGCLLIVDGEGDHDIRITRI